MPQSKLWLLRVCTRPVIVDVVYYYIFFFAPSLTISCWSKKQSQNHDVTMAASCARQAQSPLFRQAWDHYFAVPDTFRKWEINEPSSWFTRVSLMSYHVLSTGTCNNTTRSAISAKFSIVRIPELGGVMSDELTTWWWSPTNFYSRSFLSYSHHILRFGSPGTAGTFASLRSPGLFT